MLTCGTVKNFMVTWNTLFSKKMLTCRTPLNFMMTWNTLFLNNAYMWDWCWFMMSSQSLWGHKTAWNRERQATVSTIRTNFFCHQICSDVKYCDEISQERHKSSCSALMLGTHIDITLDMVRHLSYYFFQGIQQNGDKKKLY
jgi:hypothetical protein